MPTPASARARANSAVAVTYSGRRPVELPRKTATRMAARLADGAAAAAELGHDLLAAAYGDVVDTAAAVPGALGGGRDQDVAVAHCGYEADVGSGRDGDRAVAVASTGERGVGEHEDEPAVTDRVTVQHLQRDAHLDHGGAVPDVQQFHAESARCLIGREHRRGRAARR